MNIAQKIYPILPLFVLLSLSSALAQDLSIGQWRSHLNFTDGIRSEEVGNKIYCATHFGLFYYDKDDNSVQRLSKTEGFSEVEIKTMAYDNATNSLLIAYTNTKFDILQDNQIFTAGEIYRKFVSGKKTINSIHFNDGMAYIATSFGVVVYDLKRHEVRDTYSEIGDNGSRVDVNAIGFLNDSVFVACNQGILAASLNSTNLLDYKNWKSISSDTSFLLKAFDHALYSYQNNAVYRYKDGKWTLFQDEADPDCREISVYQNKLIITYSKKFFVMDAGQKGQFIEENNARAVLIDQDGDYWFTKNQLTLIRKSGDHYDFYVPNCQGTQLSWDIDIYNDVVWVCAGSITSQWGPQWNFDGVYKFENNYWSNYNYTTKADYSKLQDVIALKVRPKDGHLFAGSFYQGLLKINPQNGNLIQYNQTNSSLRKDLEETDSASIKIAGLAFDSEERLWVSNFRAEQPISVFDGKDWKSYYIGSGTDNKISKILIDQYDQKWLVRGQDGGIIVFDETRDQGDQLRYVKENEGQGNLPSENVNDLKLDLDGQIWLGTDDGIAVIYDPSAIFANRNYDAQKIWIENGDESGYLLANEKVTAIAIDGANNKWLGSKNGVWYVNEDGSKIIYHFNKDNSPLPDNQIRDIEVNQKTGEVFFGTDLGLVSFRNYATEGGSEFKEVYAFPNPVRPGYNGLIAIKGLVRDANVKITDIAGNMVFETYAEGGQATWDGKNFDGQKVKSGIYLVFSSDTDGIETNICKIMIIR